MVNVIKENDSYLIFTPFTRDLDVLVQIEPTSYIKLATTFETEDSAKYYIDLANTSGYDTSAYIIVDKDKIEADKKTAQENAETAKLKQFWSTLNELDKRLFLYDMKSGTKVKEFLDKVEDKSGIQPLSEAEYKDHRIQNLEKKLGIEFTDEQKETLRTKEI